MSDIGQMGSDDYESVLRLLADLHDLINDPTSTFTDEARLRVVDQAVTEAIDGVPEKARDYVRKVRLGLIPVRPSPRPKR